MKAKTELFLYSLLWTAETLTRPTFRNLSESFEGWAYRSGLLRRISELEKMQMLERRNRKDRVYRLTSKGRLCALGGRDPKRCWARPWDGWWRMISFDIPATENRQRDRLRYYLRSHWFGLLQRSLWISPDPLDAEFKLLRKAEVDAKSLILLQARACGGESTQHLVTSAWNFELVNQSYAAYLAILHQRPVLQLRDKAQANALMRWAQKENAAWKKAISADPLLPEALLPPGYLGQRAWSNRVEALTAIGDCIRQVDPECF